MDEPTSAFFTAIKKNDLATVDELLSVDPALLLEFDSGEFGATPLNLAVSGQETAMIDLLLRHGADLDRKSEWCAGGFAPLHSIPESLVDELGPFLVASGTTVDIHAAAHLGDAERVAALVRQDSRQVHARGGDGKQPLHFARTTEIATQLLDAGADIEARDLDHESTPAQLAASGRPAVPTSSPEGYDEALPLHLAACRGEGAPSFAVWAMEGPDDANLDRIQIVKGWVDAKGEPQDRAFDVVWSGGRTADADGRLPPVGNTVDTSKATYANTIGSAELMGTWTDPGFDSKQGAVYYVRVLEIPTPRWSTYDAVRSGLPLLKDVPATIQERAWTSPIWYSPSM